jgi:hypothetical protein
VASITILGGGAVLSTSSARAAVCTINLDGNCGPYTGTTAFPSSNGINTYVTNQNVGANSGTTQSLTANGPASWSVTANDLPLGYTGVQSYINTNQLFNNWTGSGWGSGTSDTPLTSLSALSITYNETSPGGANNGYEFSPDVWTGYAGQRGAGGDIMFWVDTSPLRCANNGLSASDILGQATFNSQNWTVYRYGSWGGEIVFVLDNSSDSDPVDNGTCARQSSGTINIKAGIDWLITHGAVNGPLTLSQLNTGWETTSADNATFRMNSLYYTATVGTGEDRVNAPYASTGAASRVAKTGATVVGSVLPEGQPTTYRFDYGTSASYGSSTGSISAGSGIVPVDESATLSGLQPSTTYHYRIQGTNTTGTGNGADKTFTTPCDCTIYSLWGNSVTPSTTSANDSSPVELGTRFTPAEDGQVDAIRFYKSTGNTGTHTGSLWTASGILLARVTFTDETSSGWETAEFPTPVQVTGGETYIVSYHAPNGHYAADYNYFTSAHTSGPLTAPADAVGAGNGVYHCCGDAIQLPAESYQSSDYYADVIFEPTVLVGDYQGVESNVDGNPAGVAEAFQYTAADTGTSATIHFYVDSSSTATSGELGIYEDNGHGSPGILDAQTSFTPHSGWNEVTLSGVSITRGATYWLAELGTGTGELKFRDMASPNGLYSETAGTGLTALLSSWPGGYHWNSGDASFYATG